MAKRGFMGVIVAGIFLASTISPAHAATSVTGSHGETLRVSKSTGVKSGDVLTVSGRHYDETIGIYVAFCKVVPKGQLPTPCGGGADKTGGTGASEWISSNPPTYGVGLAKPYLPRLLRPWHVCRCGVRPS